MHALPSLHALALFVWTHAHVVVENESFVQAFPSSHAVGWHVPPQHDEPAAHETGACVHVAPTHVATSHTSDATQLAGVHVGYWQSWAASHVPPGIAVQSAFEGVCVHPIGSAQASTVQVMPLSYESAGSK